MTPEQIRAAIAASTELTALAAAQPPQYDEIAKRLSANRKVYVSTMVSARGLASRLGVMPAEAILLALEDARDAALAHEDAAQKRLGSALRRQLKFMDGDGIDFGQPAFLAMVDQLVAAGVWTQAQGASLRGIAQVDDPVSEFEVRCACLANDGRSLV